MAKGCSSVRRSGGKEGRLGLTLIELTFIVLIVITLAGIGLPVYQRYLDNSRMVQAVVDIRTLEHDILIHEGYSQTLPTSLDGIGKSNLRDPWGNPYQYLNVNDVKEKGSVRKDHHLNPLNTDFDLYSVGKDGKSKPQINNKDSLDDVIRALNGACVGLASEF